MGSSMGAQTKTRAFLGGLGFRVGAEVCGKFWGITGELDVSIIEA